MVQWVRASPIVVPSPYACAMTTKTLHWTGAAAINDGSGAPVATLSPHDVLTLAQRWDEPDRGHTLVVPCGPHSAVDPEPSADLLSQWSQDSWEPFNTAVETLSGLAEDSETELVIYPGAGGRLSDAVCTVSWSNTHAQIPLLIDPVGWLTPSMMRDVEDHLIRFASLCEEIPSIWGVVMRSVTKGPQNSLIPAPLNSGMINPELIERNLGSISTPRRIELS